jgi:hypothetical protein
MISALIASVALLGSPPDCRPALCSCEEPGPVSQARAGKEIIFEGQVIETRDTTIWRAYGPKLRHESRHWRVIEFRIDRVWNGATGDTVRVLTGFGGGDCGYPFDKGNDYVVFAYLFEDPGPAAGSGLLVAGICSHTTDGQDAAPIRAALGNPLRERAE